MESSSSSSCASPLIVVFALALPLLYSGGARCHPSRSASAEALTATGCPGWASARRSPREPDGGPLRGHKGQHWSELLKQAKDVGEVDIKACALSMDMYGIGREDLGPLVDGVAGAAAFMASASGGQVVFI